MLTKMVKWSDHVALVQGSAALPCIRLSRNSHTAHILCGVSEVAYGGVAYMKFIFKSLEGNLVMLKEDNLSGNKWPFVPIIDLMP